MRNIAWQVLLALAIAGPALPQVKRPASIPYTPTKLDEYTAYCALWRTDATFHSTVRLKNSLDTAPIDATVTLYMADGTPYVLPPVHLAKSEVQTVDVNAALAQAPSAIQPHLSKFGSASVRYNHDWQGVVLSSMSILDTARSLEYSPAFAFPDKVASTDASGAPLSQACEGLWWRYGSGSAGFVALANTTDNPIGVEVGVSGLKGPAGRTMSLAAHSTAMLDLKDFFAGDDSRVGGLRVAWNGPWSAVLVAGGLEDAVKGFSTDLPLMSRKAGSRTAPGPPQLASAGVMVNQQDPLLNFPASIDFTPYAFFRNISVTPKTLHFGLYYMEGRTVKSLPLPDLALQPGEAREMAIGDQMRKQPQIEDFNLSFSWDGDWGDILAGVGSIDQTGSYVFPVPPEAVYKGGARGSVYWLAGGGFDTMYSLWNPEPDAHDFLVTLKYGANGELYRLPVTLEGHASTMIDIGELIRTQQLDQDGKLLPPDVKQGSLVVSGPADDLEDAIDVVLTGGIYNPTKATCGSQCTFCAGWTTITFGPTTFSLQVGAQQSLTLGYVDNYGSHYDMTPWADWETSNSSIIGLNSGPGWAQGMGGGTATVTAGYQPVPIYHGYCCGYPGPPQCPVTPIGGTATGTVAAPAGSRITQTLSSYAVSASNFVACTGSQAGWYRKVNKIVTDQNGADIVLSGQALTETVTIGTPNDLNVTGTQIGTAVTNSSGIFADEYYVCSSRCPASSGQTNASQTISDVLPSGAGPYTLSANALVYKCTGITVNGQ